MEDKVYLYVSTGFVGSDKKIDTGYTREEWEELEESVQADEIDMLISENIEYWIKIGN